MNRKEPAEVTALYKGVTNALNMDYGDGRRVGDCKHGVYLFYDYDGEPIYVGQSRESLRGRIRRHLTNQRTDAVAMSVLDPFEVAEIEMWPFWDLSSQAARETLNRAEYTIYLYALKESKFSIILNEKEIKPEEEITLPKSIRVSLLPPSLRKQRDHPDIRLARRARTIANLARVISERSVRPGLRRTLWAQARRLEDLAGTRLAEFERGDDP